MTIWHLSWLVSSWLKVWASTDVPFDWKSYNEKMMPQFTQAMMRMSEDSVKEFQKINGFQIRTEMNMEMMGQKMNQWTEVTSITNESAPAGTYTFPSSYTKKDQIDMMGMR